MKREQRMNSTQATGAQTTRTYQVNVRRDGNWWYFEIPEIGLSGQARKLSDVSFEASDIIATWLKIDADTVAVDLSVEIPDEVASTWQEAKKLEATARAENAAAARLARHAVERLRADGFTLAEAGRVLGISTQRVSQLDAGNKAGARSGTSRGRNDELVS